MKWLSQCNLQNERVMKRVSVTHRSHTTARPAYDDYDATVSISKGSISHDQGHYITWPGALYHMTRTLFDLPIMAISMLRRRIGMIIMKRANTNWVIPGYLVLTKSSYCKVHINCDEVIVSGRSSMRGKSIDMNNGSAIANLKVKQTDSPFVTSQIEAQ